MAQPVPWTRIAAYRELAFPCRIDVHPQMHSRPSMFCQRVPVNTKLCWRCEMLDELLAEDFVWSEELGGSVVVEPSPRSYEDSE